MTGLQRAVAAAIAEAGGQNRLAASAGVSSSVLSRIRRGRVGASPSMCVRLGVDPALGTFEVDSPKSGRAAAETPDAGEARAEIEAAKLALRAEQPDKVPTMIGRNDRWTRPGERGREPSIEDIIEDARRREKELRAWASELERAALAKREGDGDGLDVRAG